MNSLHNFVVVTCRRIYEKCIRLNFLPYSIEFCKFVSNILQFSTLSTKYFRAFKYVTFPNYFSTHWSIRVMRSSWKLLLTRHKWNFVHVCYIFHLIWMKFFIQEMHTEMYGWICKFCSTWNTVLQGLHEFLIVQFGRNYIYVWTVKQYDIFKVVNTLVKSVYCVTEWGTRWHYKLQGRGFDSRGSLGLFCELNFMAALWPRGRLSLYKKWVPRGISWVVKAFGA